MQNNLTIVCITNKTTCQLDAFCYALTVFANTFSVKEGFGTKVGLVPAEDWLLKHLGLVPEF